MASDEDTRRRLNEEKIRLEKIKMDQQRKEQERRRLMEEARKRGKK